MYKTMVIGNLGHSNKYFDMTCPDCHRIYDGMEYQVCPEPDCSTALVPITNAQGRKMAISEGTIYPDLSKNMKGTQAKATESTPNGMPITHRFALFSFAGDDGIVPEHPLHKYLTSGRQIQLEVNHEPIAKYYTNKGGKTCCELRYAIITGRPYNDKVTLLGKKTDKLNLRGNQQQTSPQDTMTELQVLKAKLAELEKAHGLKTQAVGQSVSDVPIEPEIPSEQVQCEFFNESGAPII